ncbi:Hypermethylated in cancer 2 protein [Nibea albiflora]|uniref:Hypermethylated in cancer 2 protein n=1 Tax=Nibea albiflora TaxID=240163 RepID=A0ACB7F8B7_NIBAL|nr:Hypermethylated in cancer 2 protein [Nibea albiflora]
MEQLSYTGQLLMKLNQQRSTGHLCDVIIMVENVLFRAHKNVLAACSGYFKYLVLRDNLITLNTKMVKPSVFKEVLDFIYTGQLPAFRHTSNLGVSALLRAASYLQLSDLAALCRRMLHKPCSSSLTTNGNVHYRPGSMEVENSRIEAQEGLQALDLSKEELLTAQCGSVNTSAAVKVNESEGKGVSEELARRSPTGDLGSSSSNSSDDVPINSTSTSYYPRLERGEPWVHKRFRCIKRQEVKEEEKMPSELEDQAEVGELDSAPKNTFQPALPDTLHLCIPCGKGFPSSEQLIAHISSHTAEELRIKAEDADKGSFTKTEDQLPPKAMKENTKPDVAPHCYVCSVCSKTYVDVVLLRQHERIHLLSRPFSCDICGKLFTQRGTMTRHMRSHLGLKPFACEECGMRFTRQYRKIEHMRIHSGEKPYECQLCGVKFSQQRSIISHLKMHTVI